MSTTPNNLTALAEKLASPQSAVMKAAVTGGTVERPDLKETNEAGMPKFLEKPKPGKGQADALARKNKNAALKMPALKNPKAGGSLTLPKTIEPAGKVLLAEAQAKKAAKTKERLKALAESKAAKKKSAVHVKALKPSTHPAAKANADSWDKLPAVRNAKKKGAKAAVEKPAKPKKAGTSDTAVSMLKSGKWTKLSELTKATGWLDHTARAWLSVQSRKNNWKLERKKVDDESAYRIV